MNTKILFAPSSDVETELLAVFAVDASANKAAKPEIRLLASDESAARAAQTVLAGGEFKAESCETLLLHGPAGLKAKRLLIVGLGKAAKLTPHEVRKGAGTAVRFAKPRGLREVAIAVPVAEGLDPELTTRALAEGAVIADYDSDTYRSDRKDRRVESVTLLAPGGAAESTYKSGLNEGLILAESQNFARALANEPANLLTPLKMADHPTTIVMNSPEIPGSTIATIPAMIMRIPSTIDQLEALFSTASAIIPPLCLWRRQTQLPALKPNRNIADD